MAEENGPIQAHIQMFGPLSANTLLHGKMSDGEAIVVSLAGVYTIGDGGATYGFSVTPDLIHLFDLEIGQRLDG